MYALCFYALVAALAPTLPATEPAAGEQVAYKCRFAGGAALRVVRVPVARPPTRPTTAPTALKPGDVVPGEILAEYRFLFHARPGEPERQVRVAKEGLLLGRRFDYHVVDAQLIDDSVLVVVQTAGPVYYVNLTRVTAAREPAVPTTDFELFIQGDAGGPHFDSARIDGSVREGNLTVAVTLSDGAARRYGVRSSDGRLAWQRLESGGK